MRSVHRFAITVWPILEEYGEYGECGQYGKYGKWRGQWPPALPTLPILPTLSIPPYSARARALLVILALALAAAGTRPCPAAEAPAGVVADFAVEGEAQRWKLVNAGPKSRVEPVAGPDGSAGVEVTCVYEPQLTPQSHSPAPYMPFRRDFDGAGAAGGGFTRLTFWHKGDSAQVVFSERERGDCYYAMTGESKEWRRISCPFHELRFGWNMGGKGKGVFDLARMESLHFAATPPPGETRQYAIALVRMERSEEDLDPRVFIGSTRPARVDLYPRAFRLPLGRTQPLLALVTNERGCGLKGVALEMALVGPGGLLPPGDAAGRRPERSLRLQTDAEGKARARYLPLSGAGAKAALTVRVVDAPGMEPARAEVTTAPPAGRKVALGANGFFAGPDGKPLLLLGGLFLPWWGTPENGELKSMAPLSVIGASEAEQRAWFAYLKSNGVNYVRGYWPWGAPLKLGPGGAEVAPSFDLEGHVNEPVVAALERTLAIGGEQGIGFSLTIADCARHFVGGYGYRLEVPQGKTRRHILQEAEGFLREFVPRLMHNPNVWAYEITNEQGGSTYDWTNRFIGVIKEMDPMTPVMVSHGGGGVQTADPLAWMKNTGLDVYQPHVYPDGGHALYLPEVDAGLLQEVHYNLVAGPKPWLLGESGGYGTHPPMGPEPDAATQQYLARDCIWFALLNRSLGASIWGIKHHANTQFRVAAEIARQVDWPALARARATVGVAVPRETSERSFFQSDAGKKALRVMADYVRWGLENGVTVDLVPDAAGYAVRRSALDPFDPPRVDAPFTVGKGCQWKCRISADGKMVAGYLRNVGEIRLHKPPAPAGSRWTVTGSYIRVRKPADARLQWRLPGKAYELTAWDLDTGEQTRLNAPGAGGTWSREQSEHDYVLVWRCLE